MASVSPVTGWADDRLMQATNLIHSAMLNAPSKSYAAAKLAEVIDLIEAADVDLEKGR